MNRLLFVLALGSAACRSSPAAEINGPPECRDCRIQLIQVVHLTASDPRGQALYPSVLVQHARGGYFMGPTLHRGTVAAFDSEGRFRYSLGRYGEGPGEMREVRSLIDWSGDSIAVVHDRNRISIFSTEPALARSITVQSVPFIVRHVERLSDGSLLALRWGTGGGEDYPIREFTVAGESPRGYGEASLFGQGLDYGGVAAAGDTIWASRRNSYEIDVFSRVTGQRSRTVARKLAWFPPRPERNEWGGAPEIIDIARDSSGRLWILLKRPRDGFSIPGLKRAGTDPVPASAGSPGVGDVRERYEYILELIDIHRGAVIAAATLGGRVVERFNNGGHLYGYTEDPETGSLTVVLWRVALSP